MEDKTQVADEKEILIQKILRWVERQKEEQQKTSSDERGEYA